jgi:hypothetical protein
MNRYNLISRVYNIYYKYFLKKNQKYFYLINRFKSKILFNNNLYYYNQNYLIKKNLKKTISNLKKKLSQIIIILYNKENLLFKYKIDKKKYERLIERNSLNFLKINTKNKSHFEVNEPSNVIKTFYIKKQPKKSLVLILILDGMSYDISKKLKYTNKFFGKSFSNAWSNAEWTLPSFNNLITGQYTSRHNCFKPETEDFETNKINCKRNIFEYFKNSDYITGCYSGNDRFNPFYNNIEGVDIHRYCKDYNALNITENIISHLEFFNETSNFIIGHILDGHHLLGKVKPLDLARFDDDKNLYFENFIPSEKKNKGFLKTAHKVWYDYYKDYKLNLYNYADSKLNNLYKYINSRKYDDLTILLIGDHGTRFNENKNYQKLLNPEINQIGFFIKQSNSQLLNKNKNISIIDIYPSLVSKYKNQTIVNNSDFDGSNILFSKKERQITISESLYKHKFTLMAKYKKFIYLLNYNMNEKKYLSHKEEFFLNENMRDIKGHIKKNNMIYKLLKKTCSEHIKRNFKS